MMRRALLLVLFALAATFSNITHSAQAAPPAPVVMDHGTHQPAQSHHDESAPCCAANSCIGCAVLPTALTPPATIDPIPFRPASPAQLADLSGLAPLPDVPPPRA